MSPHRIKQLIDAITRARNAMICVHRGADSDLANLILDLHNEYPSQKRFYRLARRRRLSAFKREQAWFKAHRK
jgi:hypothetical protein